ncbi:hypothetical protein CI102_7251 [Trichoderma harzianum]|uniref:Uncharacterized protein n=1 Tax=Trichoderma harzianum CBS 226.95 TaxID=983964 RepID=A0A2T4A4P5_TRIHA|nr:hypothetical protein M431DRAFT_91822 [Trichoderma harzianum CBS 226.95]PKK49693.1 hypothetical protein CI102_7251 [Trichoderma harzianum]PTB52039.1 hypothetical protein M431DRAFT_91822 [Trichoderma harzianum CBS 226.95]
MSNGGFVFIQEEGTGSHKPVTKSLIKMHVMDRVVMQRRALKQEHRDDDILIVNVPHSDQAPSLEHHISHNDLRSLAGIDNMLRLSGLSVELMYGDLDEAEIHFQGLKTLIRGCKGVLHLGFEGLVARIDGQLPLTAVEPGVVIRRNKFLFRIRSSTNSFARCTKVSHPTS